MHRSANTAADTGVQDQVRISKFIALILRHKPEEVGLQLDKQGWVKSLDLVKAVRSRGYPEFDMVSLCDIVDNDDKQRYAFDIFRQRIRAVQGHSVEVQLHLVAVEPPEILYHGTKDRNLRSIQRLGINTQARQYVHLSSTKDLATEVANRRRSDRSIILTIRAKQAHDDGIEFFVSENGVWLCKQVPSIYIDSNIEYPNKPA